MSGRKVKDFLSAAMELSGALLGVVEPSLRAAMVDLDMDRERYIYYFYYDGLIDEYKKELVSGAASEASTRWFYEAHFLQLDYPALIPINGILVYLRKEPELPPPRLNLLPRDSETHAGPYLAYVLGQGLLGRVIPSLRCALIDINEQKKEMGFYFYYDEKITEDIVALSKEAIAIARKVFPYDYTLIEAIEFIPFPQSIPPTGTNMVYERNEHLFD
jgi:hypothetical protein